MNKRLRELRLSLGLTQTEFGAKLGVSRDVIAGIEYGKNKPNESLVKLACNIFSVREDWLKDGIEPMYVKPESESMRYVESMLSDLDNPFYGMIRNIMRCYLELNDDGRKTIEIFAQKLINENSQKVKDSEVKTKELHSLEELKKRNA